MESISIKRDISIINRIFLGKILEIRLKFRFFSKIVEFQWKLKKNRRTSMKSDNSSKKKQIYFEIWGFSGKSSIFVEIRRFFVNFLLNLDDFPSIYIEPKIAFFLLKLGNFSSFFLLNLYDFPLIFNKPRRFPAIFIEIRRFFGKTSNNYRSE